MSYEKTIIRFIFLFLIFLSFTGIKAEIQPNSSVMIPTSSNGEQIDSEGLVNVSPKFPLMYHLNLKEGWNFISIPSQLDAIRNTAQIFSEIDTSGHSLYTFTNQSWNRVSRYDQILPLHAYWIYTSSDTAVPLLFDPGTIPTPIHLQKGWNAIGSPSIQPDYTDASLSSLDLAWSYIVPFNATVQQYDETIIRGKEEHIMYPSQGYWIYMDQEWNLQPITG